MWGCWWFGNPFLFYCVDNQTIAIIFKKSCNKNIQGKVKCVSLIYH